MMPDDGAAGAQRVSGCVISYQEEDRIVGCLGSLSFCDEILVVDSGSTDRTRELAAELGARVVTNEPFPGHREQKQFAVERARFDWVFCHDADERVSDSLRQRILRLKRAGFSGAAYEMPRRNHYLGRVVRGGLFWPDRKVRLFDRQLARWGGMNPHDRVEIQGGAAQPDQPAILLHRRGFTAEGARDAIRRRGRPGNLRGKPCRHIPLDPDARHPRRERGLQRGVE